MSEASQLTHGGAGSRVKLRAQGLGFRLYSSLFSSLLRLGTVLAAVEPLVSRPFSFRRPRSQAQREGLGFDLVSTSGLKIASCPAQEEQESLTSPLTMGKSSFAKKSKARTKSVTCQGPFCHSLSLCFSPLANGEGYLERGRLTHSWFSAQGSERLP